MYKKLVIIVAVAGLVGGVFGSLFRTELVDANLIKDFWNKLVPLNLDETVPASKPETNVPAAPPPVYAPTVDYEQAVVKAVEGASPGVVSVIVSKDLPKIEQCPYNPFGDLPPEFQQFFGTPFEFFQPCQNGTERKEVGGGSGFAVGGDLILTNKHVVSDTKADYTVLTNDGRKYSATVLARDPVLDIAILKVAGMDGVKKLKLGDSDSIKLGQTAIAIGNALGEFRNTVSVGVISGLSRNVTAQGGGTIERIEGVIQTDAAINPGNSGGPLLNLKGEVIGISTAVASGAENIGFAIPVNQAKRAIKSVEATGRIIIPYLGVRYININEALAEKEKLTVKTGALVRGGEDGPGVMKDSPAEKAGIRAEDIILELGGVKVDENNSLSSLIQRYSVGDEVTIKVLRAGKEMVSRAALEERKF